MSALTQGAYLAVLAAQAYIEVAAATQEMSEEEALERYHAVAARLKIANEMWEEAEE